MMEQDYLDLLYHVLHEGEDRTDRTGTGTRSTFGVQISHNLAEGFPLLTTKKVSLKQVAAELLWFIEGSTDERRLAELTHGRVDPTDKTIWTANAEADYWKPRAHYKGDVGRIYGAQWRRWTHTKITGAGSGGSDSIQHEDGSTTYYNVKARVQEIDQLQNIIDTIKTNPTDRRLVLTAFNPGELADMALPPCHMFCQFYVSRGEKLDCQVYIRSNDLVLGLPYNMASYALLTHLVAQVTGLQPGRLVISIGDAHIYTNHFAAAELQLSRGAHDLPTLKLNPAVKNIDDFTMSDISVSDYHSHPAIHAPMAV